MSETAGSEELNSASLTSDERAVRPTVGLVAEVAGFDAVWDAGVVAAGVAGAGWDVDALYGVLSDAAVLELSKRVGALTRRMDAFRAQLAGVVAERSRVERGSEGLARQEGFRKPEQLVSEVFDITTGQARQLDAVATAAKPRQAITGERLPSRHPYLAEVVNGGGVGVLAADVIVHTLDGLHGASVDHIGQLEKILTDAATGMNLPALRRLCIEARDRVDPDGVEPRAEAQYRRRSLTVSKRDGMTHIEWDLPPEDAAIVVNGIDAVVTRQLRGPRHSEGGQTGPSANQIDPLLEHPEPHAPSMSQLRSDAAVAVFQHAAGCANTDTVGVSHTVVVRMTLDQLKDQIGAVTLDGVEETIPVMAARRIACTAGVIPVILDGDSQPLDVGREKRYFEGPLRAALAERDRGCAWPGCGAPPSWCDGHHIEWWTRDHGPTTIDNGILLCRRHHRLIHEGHWKIENQPPGDSPENSRASKTKNSPETSKARPPGRYLIPPRHMDPLQTPRAMKPPRLPERLPSKRLRKRE